LRDGRRELGVGIAGFGGAGMAQARHFESIPGCRVRAVFDPKPGGLDRARRSGVEALLTDDFEALLRSGIDLLAVCSPNHVHADQVARGLRAGIHVICEKPLSNTLEDCARILAAERECPRVLLGVQHQMRFVPIHVRIKEAIDEGVLGTITYFEGYYVHNVVQRVRAHDSWVLETAPPPLLLSGCHFVDLARWFLGEEVEEIAGMANHLAFPEYPEPDLSVVLLRFRSGAIAKIVTAFAAARPQDHSVRVYGTERCVENNLLLGKDGSIRCLSRPSLRHGKALAAHGLFSLLRRLYGESESYRLSSYPLRLYEHDLAVRRSLEDFVECVRTGRRPRCSALDAARTVAACLAGVEACRSGGTVSAARFRLPEFDPTSS
jgi:predicted dehydrogenase